MSETQRPRRLLRSFAAVLAGILVVFVLSLGTDQVMHALEIYPPWGEPMVGTGLYILALSYRIIYGIVGGYVTARLAPHAPVGHALVLGVVGLALSTAGAVAMWNFGPHWYPIALALTALPCAWLGGVLYRPKALAV
jgi:hypothetical protein